MTCMCECISLIHKCSLTEKNRVLQNGRRRPPTAQYTHATEFYFHVRRVEPTYAAFDNILSQEVLYQWISFANWMEMQCLLDCVNGKLQS
mmetsp:Transcript_24504/g.45319  ORF Transcript_24504/g.45319 Transcript_24504/m.45319 type:complete len:90 (-) Transcript_24504:390-659(-)